MGQATGGRIMHNFSDGKTDGLVLFYIKAGTAYPVAINQNELKSLDVIIPSVITKLTVIESKPMCKVGLVNPKDGK